MVRLLHLPQNPSEMAEAQFGFPGQSKQARAAVFLGEHPFWGCLGKFFKKLKSKDPSNRPLEHAQG